MIKKIKKNKSIILTITIVAVLTLVGMNALTGYLYNVQQIQYGERLLSNPCSLCVDCSIRTPKLDINISQMYEETINNSLDCVGPIRPGINESHFRKTCESISISS